MKSTIALVLLLSVLSLPAQADITAHNPPKIQMAILLDTSSSMDGLIDQARQQLWNVVDEFSRTQRAGQKPLLEVAVYEYGNSGLSAQQGYIRQVLEFSRDLDRVSESLFSLTTNGGDEYCGYAISTALNDLQWSTAEHDLRSIFIAGNEPFTQGPIAYQTAIKKAAQRKIMVNAIHAGDHQAGISGGWQSAAMLAGGSYMSIDHNQRLVHIAAPQDERIADLNRQLNDTYIPYGKKGAESARRQAAQDSRSESVALGLLAKRVKSKTSRLYDNSTWDLVDAEENGSVAIEELSENELPAAMAPMSLDERKRYVEEKSQQRDKLKAELVKLQKARDAFVSEQRRQAGDNTGATLKEAITSAVRSQGEAQGYVFELQE